MMTTFELDSRLESDSEYVTDLPLSRVLLMNNSAVPWLVLVPRRENCVEITDLPTEDQALLWQEVTAVHKIIQALYAPDKMNVGALGCIVSQLHIHVLGRFKHDAAWPGPVWGQLPVNKYDEKQKLACLVALREALDVYSRG